MYVLHFFQAFSLSQLFVLSQLQVKVVVKQVSNSPLKKQIQIFKTVSILLFFHHIESNFVSLVLFYYLRKDMGIACLFIENGFGFEIGSAVLYDISAAWKIKFNDGLFFVKNLVKESNIVDHSVIKIHKK